MTGHTSGCISYYCPDGPFVFTGDALLIGGCGRTDFQQGNSGQLYDSIHQNLFTLSEQCYVYPAHDYKGNFIWNLKFRMLNYKWQSIGYLVSTIGEEKSFNPRLTKSRDEFIQLMKDLKLDLPKMIGMLH